jgi:hypothetical protein
MCCKNKYWNIKIWCSKSWVQILELENCLSFLPTILFSIFFRYITLICSTFLKKMYSVTWRYHGNLSYFFCSRPRCEFMLRCETTRATREAKEHNINVKTEPEKEKEREGIELLCYQQHTAYIIMWTFHSLCLPHVDLTEERVTSACMHAAAVKQ